MPRVALIELTEVTESVCSDSRELRDDSSGGRGKSFLIPEFPVSSVVHRLKLWR